MGLVGSPAYLGPQASAFRVVQTDNPKVTQWERDLNIINDTIDTWIVVQRKWQYLESIFSSEDIKQQLPE